MIADPGKCGSASYSMAVQGRVNPPVPPRPSSRTGCAMDEADDVRRPIARRSVSGNVGEVELHPWGERLQLS